MCMFRGRERENYSVHLGAVHLLAWKGERAGATYSPGKTWKRTRTWVKWWVVYPSLYFTNTPNFLKFFFIKKEMCYAFHLERSHWLQSLLLMAPRVEFHWLKIRLKIYTGIGNLHSLILCFKAVNCIAQWLVLATKTPAYLTACYALLRDWVT